MRRLGFTATTVDELCREAHVTKGAFFHHFQSKEELGVEAARYWSSWTGGMFESAAYHLLSDPLDRILGYLDLRELLLDGPVEAFTCFAGTTVQECFATSDPIRAACEESITGHARTLEEDFELALECHGEVPGATAASLALHTQTVLQGAFVLAKAKGGPEVVRDAIAHLRRYLLFVLGPAEKGNGR